MDQGALGRGTNPRLGFEEQKNEMLHLFIAMRGKVSIESVVSLALLFNVRILILLKEFLVKWPTQVDHLKETHAHGIHVARLGVVRPHLRADGVRFRGSIGEIGGNDGSAHYIYIAPVGKAIVDETREDNVLLKENQFFRQLDIPVRHTCGCWGRKVDGQENAVKSHLTSRVNVIKCTQYLGEPYPGLLQRKWLLQ